MNYPIKSDVHARRVSLFMLVDLFGGPAKREIVVSLSRPWPRETLGAPELCPAEYYPCGTSLHRVSSATRAGSVGFRHSSSRADLVSLPDLVLCREIARGRPRRTSDGVFRNHSATRQAERYPKCSPGQHTIELNGDVWDTSARHPKETVPDCNH